MLKSVEQRIIAEWCYLGQEEREGRWWWWCAEAWRGSRPCCWWCRTDSPDLGFAVCRTCGHRPASENSPSPLLRCAAHIMVSVAGYRCSRHFLYIASVSAADHLQYLLRSCGHVCKTKRLLEKGEVLHTRITSVVIFKTKRYLGMQRGCEGCVKYFPGFGKVLFEIFFILTFWVRLLPMCRNL